MNRSRPTQWLTWGAFGVVGLAAASIVGVVAAVYVWDFPEDLLTRAGLESTQMVDRNGDLLRETLSASDGRARWRGIDEVSAHVVAATVASEDRRFFSHFGVDPIAVARAAVRNVWGVGTRSGASTITQQLVKELRPRARTLWTKLEEAILAMRLERRLTKSQILEEYLNRVPYGNQFIGVESAAWGYFSKPASQLSLAEAALLTALPRAPTAYNPFKRRDRAMARQQKILALMEESAFITSEERRHAELMRLELERIGRPFRAPHLVESVLNELRSAPYRSEIVKTTIDGAVQRRAEEIVARTVRELATFSVTNAAALVIDNASGDVLAYVGSADFANVRAKGQVDGVRARRQPGSTLKPFVYAHAFDLGFLTPATLLPDVEVRFTSSSTDYVPQNFDGRFHGPVRVREALANSYNIPAVRTLERVGVKPFVARLRELGFRSLEGPDDKYAMGIVLGNDEVTLLELTAAYSALARGGRTVTPRFLVEAETAPGKLAMSRQASELVTHILADRHARTASFGDHSSLNLPFAAAVKTGTSSNYRDNWTVGYTRDFTVGVWVGDFDGRPLGGVSGVTGAAPIWRDIMLALYERRSPPTFSEPESIEMIAICPLSGERVTDACPRHVQEIFPLGRATHETCSFHRRVAVDRRNGLLAGPTCAPSRIEYRVFEIYPADYVEWAADVGRSVPPEKVSPLCPLGNRDGTSLSVAIAFPTDGERFSVLPDIALRDQAIPLRARVEGAATPHGELRFVVDGRQVIRASRPYQAEWNLSLGEHSVVAEIGSVRSPPVRFAVK